uniref:Uncharacterized protein n=1 Tax=Opuntia streptacantha TaxID=393608 RepID=A0A7C9AL30_OPUST
MIWGRYTGPLPSPKQAAGTTPLPPSNSPEPLPPPPSAVPPLFCPVLGFALLPLPAPATPTPTGVCCHRLQPVFPSNHRPPPPSTMHSHHCWREGNPCDTYGRALGIQGLRHDRPE